jgi:hypothetical protein
MGIVSWWKNLMKREDEAAFTREVEREHETREEQRFASGDMTALESDERAAETVTFHDETIEDAERLADGDDEPPPRL